MLMVLFITLEHYGKKEVHVTSLGTPIKNGGIILDILEAFLLSSAIAVIKCKAHTRGSDCIAKENTIADNTTKIAARSSTAMVASQLVVKTLENSPSIKDILALQSAVDESDRQSWRDAGCEIDNDSGLWTKEKRVVAPKAMLPWIVHTAHGIGHLSKGKCGISFVKPAMLLDSRRSQWSEY